MHWGGTLRHGRKRRNEKLAAACAEPVEDATSLWKEKEKQKQIGYGLAPIKSFAADSRGSTRIKPIRF